MKKLLSIFTTIMAHCLLFNFNSDLHASQYKEKQLEFVQKINNCLANAVYYQDQDNDHYVNALQYMQNGGEGEEETCRYSQLSFYAQRCEKLTDRQIFNNLLLIEKGVLDYVLQNKGDDNEALSTGFEITVQIENLYNSLCSKNDENIKNSEPLKILIKAINDYFDFKNQWYQQLMEKEKNVEKKSISKNEDAIKGLVAPSSLQSIGLKYANLIEPEITIKTLLKSCKSLKNIKLYGCKSEDSVLKEKLLKILQEAGNKKVKITFGKTGSIKLE